MTQGPSEQWNPALMMECENPNPSNAMLFPIGPLGVTLS